MGRARLPQSSWPPIFGKSSTQNATMAQNSKVSVHGAKIAHIYAIYASKNKCTSMMNMCTVRITEAARANVNRCKSSACAHAVTCGAVQARDLLPTPAR